VRGRSRRAPGPRATRDGALNGFLSRHCSGEWLSQFDAFRRASLHFKDMGNGVNGPEITWIALDGLASPAFGFFIGAAFFQGMRTCPAHSRIPASCDPIRLDIRGPRVLPFPSDPAAAILARPLRLAISPASRTAVVAAKRRATAGAEC
jgi:hypothetical protein